MEAFLADLWCEVLKAPSVGVEDRFLDVGGDSVLATRLAAQVQRRLGVELSIVDFFAAPTIATQAEHIRRVLLGRSAPAAPVRGPSQGGPMDE